MSMDANDDVTKLGQSNSTQVLDLMEDLAQRALKEPGPVRQVAAVKSQVREALGGVVMAMMMLERYRHRTVADLQNQILEPLVRERVIIAYPGDRDLNSLTEFTGIAIWASVSDEVDKAIREQVRAGTFPVRLKPEDWVSGEINWLLDILVPNAAAAASVLGNFKQVVKGGPLKVHPVVARQLDEGMLKKLGMVRPK